MDFQKLEIRTCGTRRFLHVFDRIRNTKTSWTRIATRTDADLDDDVDEGTTARCVAVIVISWR